MFGEAIITLRCFITALLALWLGGSCNTLRDTNAVDGPAAEDAGPPDVDDGGDEDVVPDRGTLLIDLEAPAVAAGNSVLLVAVLTRPETIDLPHVTLTTSVGELESDGHSGTSLTFNVDELTSPAAIRLHVPLDTHATVAVLGSSLQIEGDATIDLLPPSPVEIEVDGAVYLVPRGFEIRAALQLNDTDRSLLSGHVERVAFPRTESSFADGPYLNTKDGVNSKILVVRSGHIETFASAAPRSGVNALRFSDPDSDYGDRLFTCSPGDGISWYSPDGTSDVLEDVTACNGMDFDRRDVLGSLDVRAPLLFSRSTALGTLSPEGELNEFVFDLPDTLYGSRLHVVTRGSLVGSLLLFCNDTLTEYSYVLRIDSLDPVNMPRQIFATNVAAKSGVSVDDCHFGDVTLLALNEGKISAYQADGSEIPVIDGLDDVEGIAMSPEGELWIAESGRGTILTVRPTHPLAQ